jgi:hypothetical protein
MLVMRGKASSRSPGCCPSAAAMPSQPGEVKRLQPPAVPANKRSWVGGGQMETVWVQQRSRARAAAAANNGRSDRYDTLCSGRQKKQFNSIDIRTQHHHRRHRSRTALCVRTGAPHGVIEATASRSWGPSHQCRASSSVVCAGGRTGTGAPCSHRQQACVRYWGPP